MISWYKWRKENRKAAINRRKAYVLKKNRLLHRRSDTKERDTGIGTAGRGTETKGETRQKSKKE